VGLVVKGGIMSAITIQRIERMDLFQGCGRAQLMMIDELGTTLVLRAGQTVCREGEPGSQFFVLVDGLAQVQNSCGGLALLHPGAWFGETSLVLMTTHRASVTTVVDSMVLVFNRAEFNGLRDVAPQVRERLDRTAALFARGDAPTSEPWYQPVVDRMPTEPATMPANEPTAP
jgi:CRP-like cAMP-binding protein